jgi:integrase/recombinase XerC
MEGDPGYGSYLVAQGLSPRTIRTYQLALQRIHAAGLDIEKPEAKAVAEYAATVPNGHASRSQLRSTLRWYWEWKQIEGPVRAVRVPPMPVMVCRALEDDQARDLVKASLGWWPQGAAALLMAYLGLRRFEVAQAEWRRFNHDLSWYRVLGKGDRTSDLPVNPMLSGELAPRRGEGFLFPGSRGRLHVTPATVNLWIREVGRSAGLPDLTPHVLRHTCLATANDKLGDLRAVQTFARHSKPETTAGYTRTRLRQLEAVSASLDYLGP